MAGQSQAKYQRVLQVAQDLFMKFGYKAVSMDQIAHQASVSKMSIYKYFSTKDELFSAVLIAVTDYYLQLLETELSHFPHTIDKIQRLYTFSIEHKQDFSDVLLQETMERRFVMEKISAHKRKGTLKIWYSILEEGIALGDIRPMDVAFTAELLMNLPMAFYSSKAIGNKEELYRLLEHFYDFVKYGLIGKTQLNSDARSTML